MDTLYSKIGCLYISKQDFSHREHESELGFDFYGKVNIPEEITSTYFIALLCSDEEIRKRLKARPEERMCGSDEFISGQIEYNNWFRKNANKFQLCIDNTDCTVEVTAEKIAAFINSL